MAHLFPFRIHFSLRPCIDDGRVRPLSKVFSSTSQRFSVVFRSGPMCENDAPWTTLSQFEHDESWHCHLGIWKLEEPGHSVYSGSQLTSLFGHILKKAERLKDSPGPLSANLHNMVRNLGVFDSSLNFENQINNFVKGSFFQLRAIAKLKPILTQESWNRYPCFYYNQIVQNAAARFSTSTKKRTHYSWFSTLLAPNLIQDWFCLFLKYLMALRRSISLIC